MSSTSRSIHTIIQSIGDSFSISPLCRLHLSIRTDLVWFWDVLSMSLSTFVWPLMHVWFCPCARLVWCMSILVSLRIMDVHWYVCMCTSECAKSTAATKTITNTGKRRYTPNESNKEKFITTRNESRRKKHIQSSDIFHLLFITVQIFALFSSNTHILAISTLFHPFDLIIDVCVCVPVYARAQLLTLTRSIELNDGYTVIRLKCYTYHRVVILCKLVARAALT